MKTIKLTKECLDLGFVKLYRIEALIDIPSKGIKKGDKGGFVECDNQVSGNAWVYGNAQVFGNARVFDDARVYGDARVFGNAWVYGNAQVFGNARVFDDAQVFDDARVYGDARVFGDAWVYGNARVSGNARVFGDARVYGDARIDSIAAIIVFCIAMNYSVTVTKNLIFIGCKMFETKKALKITKKQAAELGLKGEYYQAYKDMIKGALRIIK